MIFNSPISRCNSAKNHPLNGFFVHVTATPPARSGPDWIACREQKKIHDNCFPKLMILKKFFPKGLKEGLKYLTGRLMLQDGWLMDCFYLSLLMINLLCFNSFRMILLLFLMVIFSPPEGEPLSNICKNIPRTKGNVSINPGAFFFASCHDWDIHQYRMYKKAILTDWWDYKMEKQYFFAPTGKRPPRGRGWHSILSIDLRERFPKKSVRQKPGNTCVNGIPLPWIMQTHRKEGGGRERGREKPKFWIKFPRKVFPGQGKKGRAFPGEEEAIGKKGRPENPFPY